MLILFWPCKVPGEIETPHMIFCGAALYLRSFMNDTTLCERNRKFINVQPQLSHSYSIIMCSLFSLLTKRSSFNLVFTLIFVSGNITVPDLDVFYKANSPRSTMFCQHHIIVAWYVVRTRNNFGFYALAALSHVRLNNRSDLLNTFIRLLNFGKSNNSFWQTWIYNRWHKSIVLHRMTFKRCLFSTKVISGHLQLLFEI